MAFVIFKVVAKKFLLKFQYSISTFLVENANPASNRVAINRNIDSMNFKKTVPVYYLEDNKEELFKKFTFSEKLSKSTFMKYLNKDGIYKKTFQVIVTFYLTTIALEISFKTI